MRRSRPSRRIRRPIPRGSDRACPRPPARRVVCHRAAPTAGPDLGSRRRHAPAPAATRAAGYPQAPPPERPMLIDFFFTLRAAKLKVSVKEYLTLLEAIKAGVIDDDDEARRRPLLLPRAHRAGQGRGPVRQVRPRLRRLLQGRRDADRLHPGHPARLAAEEVRARAQRRGEGGDREDGLGRADGDAEEALRGAEEAPRGRQQDDRHRRHLARSAPTATTRRASASARTRAATSRR